MLKKIFFILTTIFFVQTSHAEFTAEEMCEKIPKLYRGEIPIHIFFDAHDNWGPFGQSRRKEEFFSFQIVRDDILLTKLGDVFDDDESTDGFVTTQNQVPYKYIDTDEGRIFTRIFSFPRRVSPNATQSSWSWYWLCRYNQCPNGYTNGQWYPLTKSPDKISIVKGEVFALYFSKDRAPPTLNCSDKLVPFDRPTGPLDRR